MAERGGKRPGAGRKRGAPNKASAKREAEVRATGVTPLDYMLKVMRDTKADKSRRDDMAKASAPYVHPRLSAVEMSGNLAISHEEALEQMARKGK